MLNNFLPYAWASSPKQLATAAAITVAFALLALLLRGVNRQGMLAGGAASFLLYATAGPAAFAALATLFLLTWAATRQGYRRKQELGVAERGDGRNGRQVLANLGVAALCGAAFGMTGSPAWLIAAAAALSEAATDTVASEFGQSQGRTATLITTWKTVPAGTDGGITLTGTVMGAMAGAATAGVMALGGLIPHSDIWVAVSAGFLGMLADSLLGATLQSRGWMSNEAVNFWGTLVAAGMAYVIG